MNVWQPFQTPDPARYTFRVGVTLTNWRGDLPDVGTTYNDIKLPGLDKPSINDGVGTKHSDYKYTHFEPGLIPQSRGQDMTGLWLYFIPPFTEADRTTPFRTYYRTLDISLPMVVTLLRFNRSNWIRDVSRSGDAELQIPRVHVTAFGVPPRNGKVRVLVEQFLSDQAFTKLRTDPPEPRMISWDIPGAEPGGFPACLHDDLYIPSWVGNYQTVSSGGTVTDVGDSGDRSMVKVPATNHVAWRRFVHDDDQEELESKLWLRRRVIAIPPLMPDILKL